MDNLNPYSAPVARVEDGIVTAARTLAEPQTRLWAYLVDALLFIVVVLIGAALGGAIMGAMAIPSPALESEADVVEFFEWMAPVMWSAGLVALIWAVYNFVLLYRFGQTAGKRIFNIRIVRTDGRRAGFPRIFFLRLLLNGILQGLPFGMGLLYWLVDSLFIVRDDRRCIHDLIADTIVIKA